MKPGSKIFRGIGLITLALIASSCRDFSVDGGTSNLTCAASSVTMNYGSGLNLFENGTRQLVQSFKPQSTVKNVESVTLALLRVVTGTSSISDGTLTVRIVVDAGGVPSLNSGGATATLSVSKIGNFAQWTKFTFTQPISQLNAKTPYWIVLDGSFAWNANDHISWLGSDTGSYADGQALIFDKLN